MDRRNFFVLAGATGMALAASAADAQDKTMARHMPADISLSRAVATLAGKPADREIVEIAHGIASGGGGGLADDTDIICGKWFFCYHHTKTEVVVIEYREVGGMFGPGFGKLPLSEMVATAMKSRFGGPDLALKIGRDGQMLIAG